jgi:glutathione synthase/RimK-type ligase-like ATP-grasp enzyme
MKESRYKIIQYISETKNYRNSLIISLNAAQNLNLVDIDYITIHCGHRAANASIIISSDDNLSDSALYLTYDVLEELYLPEGIEIRVNKIESGNAIKFAPVLAVLTHKSIIRKHKKGLHTREAFDCYVEAGNKIGGMVYFFSLNNLDLDNNRVLGYVPSMCEADTIKWKEQWLPIPDAIHNRIKTSAGSSEYKKIETLTKLYPDINVVNRTTYIYKWRMHKLLERDKEAKKYLPRTLLYNGINTLKDMLEQFPFIYLKPVGRSFGLGIIKLSKNTAGIYTAQYNENKIPHTIQGKLDYIMTLLSPLMGKRRYIVQEGIPLATYNGNIFDLRVSVQKDETGAWSLSRWKVRVAAPSSIVTNISAGGTGAHINQVMDTVFKEDASKIMNDIKTACLTICKAIENKISGIGDIGLDIGITEGGKIYFIEANFRELRLNGGSAEDLESWKSTFKKPIYYLNYLYKNQLQNHR